MNSFRDAMLRKSNPAILEIGRFGTTPTLDDLQSLSIENRDIDDLKECVAGRCAVKLSRTMIDRFHNEIDWNAADYRVQATNLFKQMLVDYVSDYLARGESALIMYADKSGTISVAEENRALVPKIVSERTRQSNGTSTIPINSTIVWSKMNFGLKPIISINQIEVFKLTEDAGSQFLIVSKQLYANHYFDSSVAVTTFSDIPGAGSYLFYENRSRVDGLDGMFGKVKRGIVETRAIAGLKGILEHSQSNFDPHTVTAAIVEPPEDRGAIWNRLSIGGGQFIFLFLLVTAFTGLLVLLSHYSPDTDFRR